MMDKELAQFNPLFNPVFFLSLFSLISSRSAVSILTRWLVGVLEEGLYGQQS
jgi:hypothetical protein